MGRRKVTGREVERDPAEAWLAKHDPEYATRKYAWQTRSTDALARDRGEHATLREIHPTGKRGHGNYQKLPIVNPVDSRKFENELLRTATPDDDD